ncbi:MAG: ACP S-malonyltransferase [Fibrobacter sp.]|nr:ACP S-malonyltransferase [Fibrobacter sp.]
MNHSETVLKFPELHGVLFPGCGVTFTGYENVFLQKSGCDIKQLFRRASGCSSFKIPEPVCTRDDEYDELQNQLLTYIYSCAFSDILRNIHPNVSWCAFYSMGIYAALYHAGVYTFESGLKLIETAYTAVMAAKGTVSYAIATIIGLERATVEKHIAYSGGMLDIINENNGLSFVVCGENTRVTQLVDAVTDDGAIKAVILPLSAPYHAVKDLSKLESLKLCCDNVIVSAPNVKMVSCVDQTILDTTDTIKHTILDNVALPINWRKTFELLLGNDGTEFFECGPGDSLYKAGKFIDGTFTITGCRKYSALM